MKQSIKTRLPVLLKGMSEYWDVLEKIDVKFSQYKNGECLKKETWNRNSDGTLKNYTGGEDLE